MGDKYNSKPQSLTYKSALEAISLQLDSGNGAVQDLCVGQGATVRTRHGTMHWFKIGKGVRQGCILSPCLFNVYAEYNMQSAGLDESQAGIKTAGRNINNLKCADTTLMAESEEKLNSLWVRVKEESQKAGLNSTFEKLRSWHLVPSLHGR